MTTMRLLAKIVLISAAVAETGLCQCLIRGSDQPEAIPDEMAYSMMFNMLKIAPNEKGAQYGDRVDSYLALIGLAETDRTAFRLVLTDFSIQADAYDQRLNRASESANGRDSPGLKSLFDHRKALGGQARDQLATVLSEGGAAALAKHVNSRVKPRTTMPCPM